MTSTDRGLLSMWATKALCYHLEFRKILQILDLTIVFAQSAFTIFKHVLTIQHRKEEWEHPWGESHTGMTHHCGSLTKYPLWEKHGSQIKLFHCWPLLSIPPIFLPAFCGKVWQYRENIWEQCKPLSAVLIYSSPLILQTGITIGQAMWSQHRTQAMKPPSKSEAQCHCVHQSR